MKKRSNLLYCSLCLLLLFGGAAWIWASRAGIGKTTGGLIPAPRQGFLAPDFTLQDPSGKNIQLSALRGRPVLVNFWASWCKPCQAEMPAFERAYQDLKDRGLEVLAVNATHQDTPGNALEFARQYDLTFPILFDQSGEVSSLYEVQAFPSSYFVDRNGIVREVVIGGPMSEALLRIRIEQLLKEEQTEAP